MALKEIGPRSVSLSNVTTVGEVPNAGRAVEVATVERPETVEVEGSVVVDGVVGVPFGRTKPLKEPHMA